MEADKKNILKFLLFSYLTLNLLVKAHEDRSSTLAKEFDLYMSKDACYVKKYAIDQPYNESSLAGLKNLYIKNKNSPKFKKARIPKIIHQIWVGSKPVPELLKLSQKTWIEKHPGWKYKLWTNKDVENFKLDNRKLYDKASDPREKADLLRYEILYQIGGLYVDADTICLKSFDDLHYRLDFYVGISAHNTLELLNNAIIGAKPKHPILGKVIQDVKTDEATLHYRSGVFYFSQEVIKHLIYDKNINVAFPTSFFYALPYKFDPKVIRKKDVIKPNVMALHWWANSSNPEWKIKK